ncbi:glycoside hydrolase family 16 protein [Nonomuraea sp. NBC_00507]|uniref:glycoside hydrolase family 16 protein n=1 Tax=Nonomuraea sp. NBC_00507 TaxID=2976002 RepID=UPI002E186685
MSERALRRRRFLGTAMAGAAGALALGGVADATESLDWPPHGDAPPVLPAPPAGFTWTLDPAKSDDFRGDALDTDKWSTEHWIEINNNIVAFKPDNATVHRDKLHIWLKKEPYKGVNYTGGYVRSKFYMAEDTYIEVRARMIPHVANVNSAIWMYDVPDPALNPNVEIDMHEYLRPLDKPNEVHNSFHLWYKKPGSQPGPPADSHTSLANVDWLSRSNLDAGYHVYGLERRKKGTGSGRPGGFVRFYLDGVPHWTYGATFIPELVTQPRPLIFNVNGNAGIPVDSHLPASMQVDWVRVYNLTEQ